MSDLLALGISHKTAPIELRERLALTEGRAAGVLNDLRSHAQVSEAVAISTCNRTEIYLVVSDPVEAENLALGELSRQAGIRPTELIESLYSYRGIEAARHLFRVAAGLDSMIVGEAEIQGQVKRAYELALVEGATGAILNRLFRGALAAGKRVRDETRIGEGGISVPSAAVGLATRTLGDLTGRHVLLIGAGETAELTAKALAARGVEAVFVANRRYDRAIGLAERFGGSAIRLEDLPSQLEIADIVISSTNSPHHIVEREELELVAAARQHRPLLLIDLAVPRDIDPSCRERRPESSSATSTTSSRSPIATPPAARSRRAGPRSCRRRARPLRALARLAGGTADRRLAAGSRRRDRRSCPRRERQPLQSPRRRRPGAHRGDGPAIASRILHEPTLRLKRRRRGGDAYQQVAALRELFGLDAGTEPEGAGAEVSARLRRARRERRR